MSSRVEKKERRRDERLQAEADTERARRAKTLRNRVLGGVGAAVAVLAVVFAVSNAGGGGSAGATGAGGNGQAGEFAYAVGNPGPGSPAPPIELPSTDGGTWNLESKRGKRVLLYFQEGLMCQPCWDQITDIERDPAKLRALGIDEMVSITGNELDDLTQKVADEGITTPVLADPGLPVSEQYAANQYGMMGDSANGHSFVVVGPEGQIEFRADYGGAPNYTMYLPVPNLMADLKAGLRKAGAQA